MTGLGEVRVKTRAYILSKLHNHLCMLCWVCQKEFCDRVTRGTHVEKRYSEDVEHIESVLQKNMATVSKTLNNNNNKKEAND